MNCPVHNCLVTQNYTLHTSIEDFDMVLFLAEGSFRRLVKEVESTRTPAQIYGLIVIEPPHIVGDLSQLDFKMNWTVSYRTDADVQYGYGYVRDSVTFEDMSLGIWRVPNNSQISPFVNNSDLPQIVSNKTKMVAWFVSNCNTVQSQRMELAISISKYIPVDIYGKCGTLTCKNGDKHCMDMLDEDYLFYLSFENALCRDYITEKAFRILDRKIIPVIFSGADVTKLLPPHSYINVEDYGTVKELTDYLMYLARNPNEYLKYFWWKEFYSIGQLHYACDLCKKLNQWNRGVEIKAYRSLEDWYRHDKCRSPKIEMH